MGTILIIKLAWLWIPYVTIFGLMAVYEYMNK